MRGKFADTFFVEASGLPVIFFFRGSGRGFQEGKGGGGLSRVVPDQLGPGFCSRFGLEKQIRFRAGFFCFRVLPDKEGDSGHESQAKGNEGSWVKPGGELGWENAGLFGGDGKGVRHGNGRMGKAPSKGKSGPLANAQKR